MRIGKAIRIIEVESLEDLTDTSVDSNHSDKEEPRKILLVNRQEEVTDERAADLLLV
jgi:hypothetical protein